MMYIAFLAGSELLLVILAVVVLFGATRLPQLGASLGQGIRNFREAVGGKGEKDPAELKEAPKSGEVQSPSQEAKKAATSDETPKPKPS